MSLLRRKINKWVVLSAAVPVFLVLDVGYIYFGNFVLLALTLGFLLLGLLEWRTASKFSLAGLMAAFAGIACILALGTPPLSAKSIHVDLARCVIKVNQEFRPQIARDAVWLLNEEDPERQVRAVEFHSNEGGTSMEGDRLAWALQRRGIHTAVSTGHYCASTCGVAWSYFENKVIVGKRVPEFHAARIGSFAAPGYLSCLVNPRMCVTHSAAFIKQAYSSRSSVTRPGLISELDGVSRIDKPTGDVASYCDP